MQPPLSSFAPTAYTTPVSFDCIVKNKPLTAEIIEELDNPINYTFKIRYSDGAIVETTCLESGNFWVNDVRKLPYVNAIGNELHNFISVKNSEWEKFEIKQKDSTQLVWISKSTDDQQGMHYSVYYNGSYQFDLRKVKNNWEANCMRVMDPTVDEKMASLISMMIDALE